MGRWMNQNDGFAALNSHKSGGKPIGGEKTMGLIVRNFHGFSMYVCTRHDIEIGPGRGCCPWPDFNTYRADLIINPWVAPPAARKTYIY